jgi:hypothetical protein
MKSADPERNLSPEVRSAIGTFLNESQRDAQPFAITEAINAIRRVFPDLEISDADLADAIASEALTAGLDMNYDVDRWDNEGGASGRAAHDAATRATGRAQRPRARKTKAAQPPDNREARRRRRNDTDGTRRRARETKDRHELV